MVSKSLSMFFICTITLAAFSQVKAQCDTSFHIDSDGLKQGYWKGTMEGGGFGSGCYVDGKHHGNWEAFYPDSTLWYKQKYNMDLTTEFVKYSSNGKLQECVYSYHHKSGFYRVDTLFHPNGGIWRLSNFIYVQNLDSLKDQAPDDVILHNFENWVFNDKCIEYFEDGTLKSSNHYKLGRLHGESILFLNSKAAQNYDPVNFKEVNHYKNGLPHGKWRWFYSSGELSTIYKFKEGEQIMKKSFKRR